MSDDNRCTEREQAREARRKALERERELKRQQRQQQREEREERRRHQLRNTEDVGSTDIGAERRLQRLLERTRQLWERLLRWIRHRKENGDGCDIHTEEMKEKRELDEEMETPHRVDPARFSSREERAQNDTVLKLLTDQQKHYAHHKEEDDADEEFLCETQEDDSEYDLYDVDRALKWWDELKRSATTLEQSARHHAGARELLQRMHGQEGEMVKKHMHQSEADRRRSREVRHCQRVLDRFEHSMERVSDRSVAVAEEAKTRVGKLNDDFGSHHRDVQAVTERFVVLISQFTSQQYQHDLDEAHVERMKERSRVVGQIEALHRETATLAKKLERGAEEALREEQRHVREMLQQNKEKHAEEDRLFASCVDKAVSNQEEAICDADEEFELMMMEEDRRNEEKSSDMSTGVNAKNQEEEERLQRWRREIEKL